jgi:protein tyrosine phosphatase (PTP) superfamily phosphohydrolase (DUF442 family)
MNRRIAILSAVLSVCTAFTTMSAAAPAPQRLALPEPTFRFDSDSLTVPMESWQGRSVVQVMIDGRGPFPFVLDTGAGATVITKALADSLRLKVTGEAQVGSPLGGTPVPAKIVNIKRLTLGGTLQAPVSCLALDMPMPGPAKHWGVLSPNQFPGLLITWDFARQRIVLRRGSLPASDDVQVFSYEGEMLPTMPVEIAGRRVRVHVDTGSPDGLMLPGTLKDSLPLAGPPVEGRTARSVDREFKLLDAKLAGRAVVGGRTYTDPAIQLSPAARVGNIGSRMLKDFEVTLDAEQQRIRLRPLGELETPGAAGTAPTRRPPATAEAKSGAAEIAAIAPGLGNAMIPLPGVATAGLPRVEDYAAFARAGYRTVVDLCTPGEPRGYDEAQVVRAAGLDYVTIPFTRTTLSATQIEEFRRLMRDPARRPVLVHCIAANRVGGIMLPYLMLDEGMSEEEALALARKIGLHSPEMETVGLEYARTQRGRTK